MKYQHKLTIVEATQVTIPTEVITNDYSFRVNPYDFIVTGIDGVRYPVDQRTFNLLYDKHIPPIIVDEEGAEL